MFHANVKVLKGRLLFSAVSGPRDWAKRFIFLLSDRPVQRNTISAYLGRNQPRAKVAHTNIHESLYLSELEQCRMNKIA